MGRTGTKLGAAVESATPGLRASDDEADRTLYARDLWPRHHLSVRAGASDARRPGAIVWPESSEQVARVVQWARREGVPLVPFGGGSGVCGGVLPREDAVVVDMKRMARVRELTAEVPSVEVEAGIMGLRFEEHLGRAGFTLGHFPSSILCSTVGGWVAARSAGQCSGAYGKFEDMVAALECVTGDGQIVRLRRRSHEADLTPLLVGSEGTLAVVTSATLRLHPSPPCRAFGAWSFPTVQRGLDAMRDLFQAGLRPAVARLYDPFDAMLARRGGRADAQPRRETRAPPSALGGMALRAALGRAGALHRLLTWRAAERALGGALLLVVFEGPREATQGDLDRARQLVRARAGAWQGEDPARRWLHRRYAVSYRQAPMFARGGFVDTFEVAAPWSKLHDLYLAVRDALGMHVFVMAHFSHPYPDGCCIYFSFAGAADADSGDRGWDEACEVTYDRAWRLALTAAVEAGGTIAHHHGVGRSKAPRIAAELGQGADVVRAVMRAFDPAGILNPGNLLPAQDRGEGASPARPALAPAVAKPTGGPILDQESLLACLEGSMTMADAERALRLHGLTLDARDAPGREGLTVSDWLALGAPGARDPWLDPVDHLLAGLRATLRDGRTFEIRPAPRRAVGPDLTALFVGAQGRFGRVDQAWLRVHRIGAVRPTSSPFRLDREPPLHSDEVALLDRIARQLART